MSSTLPLEWTPITSATRDAMNGLIGKFETNRQAAALTKTAAAAAAKDSVNVELLRSMKESGVPDDDIILIAATMLANK